MMEGLKKWFAGTKGPQEEMCATAQRMEMASAGGVAMGANEAETLQRLFPVAQARPPVSAKVKARRVKARKSANAARRVTRRNQK